MPERKFDINLSSNFQLCFIELEEGGEGGRDIFWKLLHISHAIIKE